MSNFFKKALGVFVEFDPKQSPPRPGAAGQETGSQAAGAQTHETVATTADAGAPNPDVERVAEAIKLLSTLPLSEIPTEKARDLIVRTLEFAGMEPAALLGSFRRATQHYQTVITDAQTAITARQQQHQERLQLLEQAIAEEKAQSTAEIGERNGRIAEATARLAEIQQAMAFFAEKETGTAHD